MKIRLKPGDLRVRHSYNHQHVYDYEKKTEIIMIIIIK